MDIKELRNLITELEMEDKVRDWERKKIKTYLEENPQKTLDLCKQINLYSGDFDFVETNKLEELADYIDAYKLARAIICGNVSTVDSPVRYDAYGNLYTIENAELESEAMDYIDEIIDEYLYEYLYASWIDVPCEIQDIKAQAEEWVELLREVESGDMELFIES